MMRGISIHKKCVRCKGESGSMSAFRERAFLGLMVGASTIAVSTSGVALAQTPPPADQTQKTEEQRPTTANATAADAPPATPSDDIVITGIRASLRESMQI